MKYSGFRRKKKKYKLFRIEYSFAILKTTSHPSTISSLYVDVIAPEFLWTAVSLILFLSIILFISTGFNWMHTWDASIFNDVDHYGAYLFTDICNCRESSKLFVTNRKILFAFDLNKYPINVHALTFKFPFSTS